MHITDHLCDCKLPSRVKISRAPENHGRKFRNGIVQIVNFDEDEGRTDGIRYYIMKLKDECNLARNFVLWRMKSTRIQQSQLEVVTPQSCIDCVIFLVCKSVDLNV
uniref:Uncharacterized protein n=1 Tax=Lactuca sativa TaxID=4236 RepID=A0A9R1WM29_LACSA|nr:hypothetical protein LSAT_V11C900503550 [Lactuca sativa]